MSARSWRPLTRLPAVLTAKAFRTLALSVELAALAILLALETRQLAIEAFRTRRTARGTASGIKTIFRSAVEGRQRR